MLKLSDVGVIADDLTGAADAAGYFVRAAGGVPVFVFPELATGAGEGFHVINTQSRLLEPARSRELLSRIGKTLGEKSVIFKKIDSVLRGPVGAELEGLAGALGDREVILVPACPRLGRTTRNGIHYVHGIPVDETAYATDPVSPIHSSDVARIVAETGNVKCSIPDAETDDDLRKIVKDALAHAKVILAGSVGLADALSQEVYGEAGEKVSIRPSRRPLVVCGSQYEKPRTQVMRAVSDCGATVIDIRPSSDDPGRWQWPENAGPVIVRLVCNKQDLCYSTPQGILSGFAGTVSRMMSRLRPDALGLVGGETAFYVLKELGIGHLRICHRLAEVVNYGMIDDGAMTGYPFATKSGSIGSDRAIVEMINQLQSGMDTT